jgi:hypothetical protein
VLTLAGTAARVLGPARVRVAPNSADLDHLVAQMKVGRSRQAELRQHGLGNQSRLRMADFADRSLHRLAPVR